MDYKEVIEELSKLLRNEKAWLEQFGGESSRKRTEALNIAIAIIEEGLREMKPEEADKKIIEELLDRIESPHEVINNIWGVYECPCCGKVFSPYEYGNKHCNNCGQYLKWR